MGFCTGMTFSMAAGLPQRAREGFPNRSAFFRKPIWEVTFCHCGPVLFSGSVSVRPACIQEGSVTQMPEYQELEVSGATEGLPNSIEKKACILYENHFRFNRDSAFLDII